MLNYRSWSNHCRVLFSYTGKTFFAVAGYAFLLFVFTLSLCLTPMTARAQILQLSDENLSGISGQAGVSINMDVATKVHLDVIKFSDTASTPNWIELYDVNVDDGAGGPFFSATRYYDEPVTLVTNFLTYYAADPTKSTYTWAANEFQILTDPMVQNGTIAGLEDGMKRVLYPIIFDVGTDSGGRTVVSVRDSSAMSPRTYSVGSLVINAYDIKDYSVALVTAMNGYMTDNSLTNAQFVSALGLSAGFDYASPATWTSGDLAILNVFDSGTPFGSQVVAYQTSINNIKTSQPLGSIKLAALRQGPSLLNYWAHAGQGISFDYRTAISADFLTYTYNTTPTTLSLTGINIAGSATGAPETPSSWAFSGDFKIGSIGDTGNTPATIDVATDSSNNTFLSLNLPMSGTVRVADVNFGGQSFGPIAIDGMQVHSLNVKITP